MSRLDKTGNSYCGTPYYLKKNILNIKSYYMAPEILQNEEHDYKADLWSIGDILFYMIFRKFTFI